ncbi:MAG TPA: molybdenum cofactor biosynthesis protein MoaE [Candidatus Limnocylindrales bacterium]
MKIRVRLFAMHREIVGSKTAELELADASTLEDAWAAMAEAYPALGAGRAAVRFARNGAYAEPTVILADGDEVAFIPPVSGGSGDGPAEGGPEGADDEALDRRRVIQLMDEPFPEGLAGRLSGALATDEDGAVVVFIGRTRVSAGTPAPGQEAEAARHEGRHVRGLDYEALEPMALDVLGQIADEIEERFGVVRLAIVHRVGDVPLGEPSILVVAASPHRDAAFKAAHYAIDETKARAPIWKAERFADGHVWIGQPARTGPENEGS